MTDEGFDLSRQSCQPCRQGGAPLTAEKIREYKKALDKDWQVIEEHHMERTFRFKNFKQALEFTNSVGQIAEKQGHHPVICLSWGQVTIKLWTHKINALDLNDFILASKIDRLNPPA